MEAILLRFVGSVVAAYVVAVAVGPLLSQRTLLNRTGCILAMGGIAACPAIIPAENVIARAFSCLLCIDPLFRVLDYGRQMRKGPVQAANWRKYLEFLIPFPFLLTVFGAKERARHAGGLKIIEAGRLLLSIFMCACVLFVCLKVNKQTALRESFVLDHLTKMLLFLVFVETASRALLHVERLRGYSAPPVIDRVYLAKTPAEFWFRFNQRVRQWLYLNVFVPVGGRRSPLRGIVVVFLVSAIFHEIAFDLATSRADGCQFAFFMLQAPAVLFSPQLERLSRRGIAGLIAARGLTFLWLAVTSPLFFRGLNQVFPFFYAREP